MTTTTTDAQPECARETANEAAHEMTHYGARTKRFVRTKRTGALAGALVLLVLAGATAVGCGETNETASTPVGTNAQTSPDAAAAAATTTTTAAGAPADGHHVTQHTAGAASRAAGAHGGVAASAATKTSAGSVLSALGAARVAHRLSRAERGNVPVADIALSSPALSESAGQGARIARASTCDGAGRSPALHWSSIPAGTAELAIVAISSKPVAGKLFFDWAIAGINPRLHGLAAGETPAGAVLGRNGYGQNRYTLCPAAGQNETYVFTIYALPQSLALRQGFDPATLRRQALRLAHHTGILVATYKRT